MRKRELLTKIATLAAVTALTVQLGGCGTDNSADTSATDTPAATESTTTDEPEATTESTSDNSDTTATAETKDASYQTSKPKKGDTIVTISFENFGDVKIKMFPKEAPKAVENFTTHATDGYYDGLTMHRVINKFMIQGGDPTGTGTGGESIWGSEFENETVEYLLPIRGSLCMANAGPDTNGSQFFITQCKTKDIGDFESQLTDVQKEMYETYGGCPWLTGGYTVFGQVYEGMDVVDAISKVKTDASTDAPLENVVISHITVETYEE